MKSWQLSGVAGLVFGLVACGGGGTLPVNVVGSTGGTVNLASGVVNMVFPANAVATNTTITALPISSGLPTNRVTVEGSSFDFGPNGTTFAQPVALTLKYDPSKLPLGTPETDLVLAKKTGTDWVAIAGSTVNAASDTVSANLTGFSEYAVVVSSAPAVNLSLKASRDYGFTGGTLNGTPNDPDRFGGVYLVPTLNGGNPVDAQGNIVNLVWTSVPAAPILNTLPNGVFTPTAPGTYTITANGNGATSSVVVKILARKVWHASWREFKIRGFNQGKWGSGTSGNADTTIDLTACNNAKPNDIIQDEKGNLIFTDNANGRVIRLDYSIFSSGGNIVATSAQCRVISSGYAEIIGLLRDVPFSNTSDMRGSLFFATQNGVYHLRYNTNANTYAEFQLVAGVNVAGLAFGPNMPNGAPTLVLADYAGANNDNAALKIYEIALERDAVATLRLTIRPTGSTFALPEGIAFANDTYWVANNRGSNIMGFSRTDLTTQLSTNPGTTQNIAFKSLEQTVGSSYLRCPGGLVVDFQESLWVNIQGSSSAASDCGNTATAFGTVSKYTLAQLSFAGNSSTVSPTNQLTGIASVPGFGGITFGR